MHKSADEIMALGRLVHFLFRLAFFKPKKSIINPVQPIQEIIGEEKLQELINFALRYMSEIVLPVKRSNFVEIQNGMINLSPIGQSCTKEERQVFVEFDKEHGIRKKFVKDLKREFGIYGLDFAMDDGICVMVTAVTNIEQFVLANKQDAEEFDQSMSKTDVSESESISSMSSSNSSSTERTYQSSISSSPEVVKSPVVSDFEDDCAPSTHDFTKEKDEYFNCTALIVKDPNEEKGYVTYWVSKHMLAMQSPVFYDLFFGNPKDNDKQEFNIEIESYPHYFPEFLEVVYDVHDFTGWDDGHFQCLIEVTNQFKCEYVIKKILSFFLTFPEDDKFCNGVLWLAEKYSWTKFMDEYIKRIKTDELIEACNETGKNCDYYDLSEETLEKAEKELKKRGW